MAELGWIDVLEIVIGQIGGIRVPVREKEIADALDVVLHNLSVLRESIEQAGKEQVDTEETASAEGSGSEETAEETEVKDGV